MVTLQNIRKENYIVMTECYPEGRAEDIGSFSMT